MKTNIPQIVIYINKCLFRNIKPCKTAIILKLLPNSLMNRPIDSPS